MTKHYNTSIIDDASRIFNTKGNDTILNDVNPIIQPVIEIKRNCNIVKTSTLSNTTSGNIYTTPADKDFYLTGIHFSYIKDVTSTATSLSLQAFIEGISSFLIRVKTLTLTVGSDNIVREFNLPIKIDRNTAITITSDTGVANIGIHATITGYTVETTKGV